MLIDAAGNGAGNEVRTRRCACGRHMPDTYESCCGTCESSEPRIHGVACSMRQEHFPDTRRGVVASEVRTTILDDTRRYDVVRVSEPAQ